MAATGQGGEAATGRGGEAAGARRGGGDGNGEEERRRWRGLFGDGEVRRMRSDAIGEKERTVFW
uniref:Uncharacterized protein n=1 Tax=Oryza glumipatula TaxID=40148 RepID=A0A0E0BMH8_9ORYZ